MNRKEAEDHVLSLYELQEPFLSQMIAELGMSAFSDKAMIRLAELHLAEERRKSRVLETWGR